MRLLLLNHEFPPAGGGAANACLEISKALLEVGHAPHVITSRHPQGTAALDNLPFPVTFTSPRRRKLEAGTIAEMLCYVPFAALAAHRLHKANPFHGCVAFFSIPGGAAARLLHGLCQLPYLVLLRGGDVPGTEPQLNTIHRFLTPLRRSIYRHAILVAANSQGLRQVAEKADPGFQIGVLPNGVDTSFFHPPATPPSLPPFRLLFVGRLHPQKNVHLIIQALPRLLQLAGMPCHFEIVGDGTERSRLEALANSLGVSDSITFHGWLDKKSLLARYQTAHVFINPSSYEGMPNSALEAMACGLPVIVSNVPGNRDLPISPKHGDVMLDAPSLEELCKALTKTLATRQQALSAPTHTSPTLHRQLASWLDIARRLSSFFINPS